MAAVISEFKTIETAILAYYQDNNVYPLDRNPGILPPGLEEFLSESFFTSETPVGGVYDYEGPPAWPVAGVSIRNAYDNDAEEWNTLDAMLDDGNTNTGKFRFTNGWYVYVVDDNP